MIEFFISEKKKWKPDWDNKLARYEGLRILCNNASAWSFVENFSGELKKLHDEWHIIDLEVSSIDVALNFLYTIYDEN